jgi:hypothetical protein
MIWEVTVFVLIITLMLYANEIVLEAYHVSRRLAEEFKQYQGTSWTVWMAVTFVLLKGAIDEARLSNGISWQYIYIHDDWYSR